MRHVDAREEGAEHVVHRARHVLDAPAREHRDVGRRALRDETRDIAQRIERARQTHQDDTRAGDECGVECGRRCDDVGQTEARRIGRDRALAHQSVLVHADATCAASVPGGEIPGRAEGQRAVGVADDDDLARGGVGPRRGGLVENQAVGGIHRHESRRLDIGRSAQRLERKRRERLTRSRHRRPRSAGSHPRRRIRHRCGCRGPGRRRRAARAVRRPRAAGAPTGRSC